MSTELESEDLNSQPPTTETSDQEEREEHNSIEKEAESVDNNEELENEAQHNTGYNESKDNAVIKIEPVESKEAHNKHFRLHTGAETKNSNAGLTVNLAVDMLTHYKEYLSQMVKNWRPKEGEVYVFDLKKVGQQWKNDGYEWRNNGYTLQPKAEPLLKKTFFLVRSSALYEGDKAFQKVLYQLTGQADIILVHYFGDSTIPMAVPKRMRRKVEADQRLKRKAKVEDPSDLSKRALTVQETVETLENYEQHLSVSRAIHPKGGEIYLFDRNLIGEDWKCDGYIWRNSGTRYMPSKNPILRKNFYFIRTKDSGDKGSREFKKSASFLLVRPNIVLVHYMGNETVFTPRPHGNRKKGDVQFERTCPSVLEAIKNTVVEEGSVETFQRLKEQFREAPRDMKQVQSVRERLTRSTRIPRKRKKYMSQDELQQQQMVEIVEMTGSNTHIIEEIDTSKITDENLQPLLMEPLSSHPEIRQAQIEVLQQQQRNQQLLEDKLQLEIEKLERNRKLVNESTNQSFVEGGEGYVDGGESLVDGNQIIQYVDDNQGVIAAETVSNENVIYVNSESDLYELTREMVYSGEEGGQSQYVLVQGDDEVDQMVYQQIE